MGVGVDKVVEALRLSRSQLANHALKVIETGTPVKVFEPEGFDCWK
jgi:hypothetical protein